MPSVQITKKDLIGALRLPETANTALPFDRLGIDSWDFIEFRAVLETRFGLIFSDEEWVEMSCPEDVLRHASAHGE